MTRKLFSVEEGITDGHVYYLSGEEEPSQSNNENVQNAPTGSEYSQTSSGEKWMKTPQGWKKLAFQNDPGRTF